MKRQVNQVKRLAPATMPGAAGVAFIAFSLLLSGCKGGQVSAEDPACAQSHGVPSKQLPRPTGSPYPKEELKREYEASPRPSLSLSAKTGKISTDDLITLNHYANPNFVPTSAWRIKCGDRYDTLSAGRVGAGGYIVAVWTDVTATHTATYRLAAPAGVGELTVTSAGCDGFRLRDSAGNTLTYLPDTNSWKR